MNSEKNSTFSFCMKQIDSEWHLVAPVELERQTNRSKRRKVYTCAHFPSVYRNYQQQKKKKSLILAKYKSIEGYPQIKSHAVSQQSEHFMQLVEIVVWSHVFFRNRGRSKMNKHLMNEIIRKRRHQTANHASHCFKCFAFCTVRLNARPVGSQAFSVKSRNAIHQPSNQPGEYMRHHVMDAMVSLKLCWKFELFTLNYLLLPHNPMSRHKLARR